MTDTIELKHHLTIDSTEYRVLQLSAREVLDDFGEIRCEITDREGGPNPAKLTGKSLTLTLTRPGEAQEHVIAGYVVMAESGTVRGTEESGTFVVAKPHLFRLTQRSDCRIFQEMSAPDIVKKVLEGAGISAEGQAWKLKGTYPKRAYTTQYRETDFEFVRRILSEEGIAFTIDSRSGSDVVVFFDGNLGNIEGDKTIVFRSNDGLNAGGDAIGALRREKVIAPGRVNLRDYDFERPRFQLDAKAESDSTLEKPLEVYQYPGRFKKSSDGERYAKILLDSLRARCDIISGSTNTLRLQTGHIFKLDEHPYAPLNQEYLLVEVTIRVEARHHNRKRGDADKRPEAQGDSIDFQAIPIAKTTYRPPRTARALAVAGAQFALTTGAPGKEIHPDQHGRVKVLFPWDRLGKADDSSSLWIRTCQLPLGGSMLTPRVGWETYLNFTDGDPDMPFVFGRMYNGKTLPPYALPEHRTRTVLQTATTPGGGSANEIRMDDKAGSEEIFINASKDATISTGNNATESVGNNESRSIGANRLLSITDSMSAYIGADQKLSVGTNQTVHVATFMVDDVGSHSLTIGGNRDLKAGGDHKLTVTGASTLEVGGMQIDLVAGSVDENSLSSMKDKVGAALLEMTPSDRTVCVTGSRTEQVTAAKIILSAGGRAVTVGTNLDHQVVGAILTKIKGNRSDLSAADFIELAGGAQIVKAANVLFEAENLLSVVMGASTITLTPASVSIAGTKIILDGDVEDKGALVLNN